MAEPLFGALQEEVVRALHGLAGKVSEAGFQLGFELLQLAQLFFVRALALVLAALKGGSRFREAVALRPQFAKFGFQAGHASGDWRKRRRLLTRTVTIGK
jgi:hypothetical protein